MRFMMLYKPGRETDTPSSPQDTAAVGRAGVLIAIDRLLPSSQDVRRRISRNEFLVTDGPFAETKELIGG
jgi:hypothetical protein